jgi:hypothetical protein
MSTDQSYAGGRALFAQAMTADFPWPVTRGVTPGSESGAMPRGARTEVVIRVGALSTEFWSQRPRLLAPYGGVRLGRARAWRRHAPNGH